MQCYEWIACITDICAACYTFKTLRNFQNILRILNIVYIIRFHILRLLLLHSSCHACFPCCFSIRSHCCLDWILGVFPCVFMHCAKVESSGYYSKHCLFPLLSCFSEKAQDKNGSWCSPIVTHLEQKMKELWLDSFDLKSFWKESCD